MTTETMERTLANRAAHAMRTAAIRLARERAGQESDPTLAYGCVDWFRYDAPHTEESPEAAREDDVRGDASLHH
jgi:hypothetical protein